MCFEDYLSISWRFSNRICINLFLPFSRFVFIVVCFCRVEVKSTIEYVKKALAAQNPVRFPYVCVQCCFCSVW